MFLNDGTKNVVEDDSCRTAKTAPLANFFGCWDGDPVTLDKKTALG